MSLLCICVAGSRANACADQPVDSDGQEVCAGSCKRRLAACKRKGKLYGSQGSKICQTCNDKRQGKVKSSGDAVAAAPASAAAASAAAPASTAPTPPRKPSATLLAQINFNLIPSAATKRATKGERVPASPSFDPAAAPSSDRKKIIASSPKSILTHYWTLSPSPFDSSHTISPLYFLSAC